MYIGNDGSPNLERLSQAIERTVTEEQSDLLMRHLEHVLLCNKKTNLTRINDKEEAMLLHIEDSLSALLEVESAPQGLLVDMGSGAGYPGIPLAIVTERNTTLVEATGKKARVLEDYVQASGLVRQIVVENKRLEKLSREKQEVFAVATARAVSALSAIMELAAPLLIVGGVLVAYKGNITESELKAAKNAEGVLGMKMRTERKLVLSDNKTQRRIIVITKVAAPKIALPRREGQAQSHPLL